MSDGVRETLRTFILSKFLPGEPPETLQDSTRLVTSGIITSLTMLELAEFIEESFSVRLAPDDLGVSNMDSIDRLVALIGRAKSADTPRMSG
jgi:acyl carrier protein